MIADLLERIAAKETRLVAGFMSGTSMDGIDVVITQITGSGRGTHVKLLGFSSQPYNPELRQRLLRTQMPDAFTAKELADLSFQTADLYTMALTDLIRELGLSLSDLDLIGHHGIALYHGDGQHVDICEASVIAERTGITVITDFRVRDCAAGGQGAPLSPYVDWVLFNHPEKNRVVQNIGGIANVCAIPAGGGIEDLIGFDTGPGNMIIDGLVSLISGGQQAFDRDGEIARAGQVNKGLLTELMAHPFIQRSPPKSTGREEFGMFFATELLEHCRTHGIPEIDAVATATAFTAQAIANAYQRFIAPRCKIDEVIVGGGGVHNPVLMNHLHRLLAPIPLQTHEEYGIASDAREALSWAVLANETLLGNPTNVPQITGARRPAVLGKIILGEHR